MFGRTSLLDFDSGKQGYVHRARRCAQLRHCGRSPEHLILDLVGQWSVRTRSKSDLIKCSLLTSIARFLSDLRPSFVHLQMPIQAVSGDEVSHKNELGAEVNELAHKGL